MRHSRLARERGSRDRVAGHVALSKRRGPCGHGPLHYVQATSPSSPPRPSPAAAPRPPRPPAPPSAVSPGSSPSRASTLRRSGRSVGEQAAGDRDADRRLGLERAAAGRWPAATARARRSRRCPAPAGRPAAATSSTCGASAATSAGEAPAAQRTSASKSSLRVAASTRSLSAVRGLRPSCGPAHRAERRPADGVAAPLVAHLPAVAADPVARALRGPAPPRCCRSPRSPRCPGRSSNAPASAISMSVVTTTRAARFSARSAFASSLALRLPAGAGRADVRARRPQAGRLRPARAARPRRSSPAEASARPGPHRGARTVGSREDPVHPSLTRRPRSCSRRRRRRSGSGHVRSLVSGGSRVDPEDS